MSLILHYRFALDSKHICAGWEAILITWLTLYIQRGARCEGKVEVSVLGVTGK